MRSLRSGLAGFVGGLKGFIRGHFVGNYSETSEAPVYPDVSIAAMSIIAPSSYAALSTINSLGVGENSTITTSYAKMSIIAPSSYAETSTITDTGYGASSGITDDY